MSLRGLPQNSKKKTIPSPGSSTLDSAIHRINLYPVDSAIVSPKTYPLDSDLSGG